MKTIKGLIETVCSYPVGLLLLYAMRDDRNWKHRGEAKPRR